MPRRIESPGFLNSNRQMVRLCRESVRPERSGYSLIELLIVMAILAAMAAFALPSLQGPLDKSRLRAGAREIRAAMGKARALAIREGATLVFRYQVGGRDWQLQRTAPSPVSRTADTGGFLENASDPRDARSQDVAALGSGLGPFEAVVVRVGQLPGGTEFAPPRVPVTESELSELEDEFRSPAALVSMNLSTKIWSPPITFRPNGRSEDATLSIRGNRDFVVDLTLRGLTSAVSYTRPFRRLRGYSEDVAFLPTSDVGSEGVLR